MQDVRYPTRRCDIGSAHGMAKLDSGSWLRRGYGISSHISRKTTRLQPPGSWKASTSGCKIPSEFPQIGHRYEGIADQEVRILLYGHYRIACLIKSEESIDILGVFHGALNIQRYLI